MAIKYRNEVFSCFVPGHTGARSKIMSDVLGQRIFRCDRSDYYGNEIEVANETHSDIKLRAIADSGFNGIWLHGEIRELVATSLFKDYPIRADKAQNALK